MLSLLYILQKKKGKRLYLEERRIPITNMTEETVTATEIERNQMMIETEISTFVRSSGRRNQSNKTEGKVKRINRL